MATAKLDIIIELQKRNESAIKDIQNQLGGLDKTAKETNASSGSLMGTFIKANIITQALSATLGFAKTAMSGLASGFKDFVGLGIQVSADMETARAGLMVFLKDTQKVDSTLARLREEAKRTPFELPGLTQATQLLTAVTKDGDKSIDILLDVGESLSAVGKGQAELDRVVVNLQQIAATGRATSIDIKQFAFAGLPIYDMITAKTGLAGEALAEFIEGGGVTFDLLTSMFDQATTEGGMFFGAFEKQAGTFNQLMANMKDNIGITAMEFVNQSGAFDIAKQAIAGVNKVIEWLSPLLTTALQNIKSWVTEGLEKAAPYIQLAKDTIGDLKIELENLGVSLFGAEGSTKDFVVNGVELAVTMLAGMLVILKDIVAWINENPEIFKAIKDSIKGAYDQFVKFTEWVDKAIRNINILDGKVKAFWEGIAKAIDKWDNWITLTNNDKASTPKYKQRAMGGMVNESSTWVGENGPELVSLPKGSQVFTNAQSRGMFSGSSSINLGGITINNPIMDSPDRITQLRDQVVAEIANMLARQNQTANFGLLNTL